MGKNSKKIKPISLNNADNEFDVRRNLQKLKSGRNNSNYVTEEYTDKSSRTTEYITNKSQGSSYETTDLLGLNDNMHLRYDKLKDDFNVEIKEIKKDYSTFSKEVTEKYLTKTEFWFIISGLLGILTVIGILFYTLSYQDIKDDVRNIKENSKVEKKEKEKAIPH